MQAQEVMTRDVISVHPDTSVRDIASQMAAKRISGVPVVAEGRIVGIVSESDLLHRAEVGTERKRGWWFRYFGDPNALAQDYAKAHGLKAHDVMSRYVVSVAPEAELRDVADILDSHGIKRVPVVRDNRLVGIITRGDLVRALSQVQIAKTAAKLGNAALHKALYERIRAQAWIDPSYISISVQEGVVDLSGFVETVDRRNALTTLVGETEGVSHVNDHLTVGVPFRGAI